MNMSKASRIFLALIVCIVIFALWIVFQMYVAKGFLVGILFCSAMFGAWKAIVNGGEKTTDEQQNDEKTEAKEEPQTEYNQEEK